VTRLASLSDDEAAELGPLLRRASKVAERLVSAEQTYNCLRSHAGGVPVHIHYVVQPVTAQQMAEFQAHGPSLQVAMFSHGEPPKDSEIERVAERARQAFASE
jgi:diadenosine tetraphosphate (Ap4A) HIT family hydrolase